ncbi:MAG: type III pantothenate kinase [Pseudomonadota bacterium]
MKLLIDFGNTRFKWAILQGGRLGEMSAASYESDSPIDCLESILQTLPLDSANEVHVVSVLSEEFNSRFKKAANENYNIPVDFYFSHKEKYGVLLSYANPEDYGADRYASMVAVHHIFSGNKIVIDCGTAVTIDAIDQQGKHLGGIILAGEEILLASLADNAQRVFYDKPHTNPAYLNASTSDAVLAGAALGLKHSVWGIINEIRHDLADHILIFTGGNAARLDDSANQPYHTNSALILEGLKIMLNLDNKESQLNK